MSAATCQIHDVCNVRRRIKLAEVLRDERLWRETPVRVEEARWSFFDAIGQRREKQVITFIPDHSKKGERPTKVSVALDTRGTVAGIPNSDFASPKELGKILAESTKGFLGYCRAVEWHDDAHW